MLSNNSNNQEYNEKNKQYKYSAARLYWSFIYDSAGGRSGHQDRSHHGLRPGRKQYFGVSQRTANKARETYYSRHDRDDAGISKIIAALKDFVLEGSCSYMPGTGRARQDEKKYDGKDGYVQFLKKLLSSNQDLNNYKQNLWRHQSKQYQDSIQVGAGSQYVPQQILRQVQNELDDMQNDSRVRKEKQVLHNIPAYPLNNGARATSVTYCSETEKYILTAENKQYDKRILHYFPDTGRLYCPYSRVDINLNDVGSNEWICPVIKDMASNVNNIISYFPAPDNHPSEQLDNTLHPNAIVAPNLNKEDDNLDGNEHQNTQSRDVNHINDIPSDQQQSGQSSNEKSLKGIKNKNNEDLNTISDDKILISRLERKIKDLKLKNKPTTLFGKFRKLFRFPGIADRIEAKIQVLEKTRIILEKNNDLKIGDEPTNEVKSIKNSNQYNTAVARNFMTHSTFYHVSTKQLIDDVEKYVDSQIRMAP